MTTTKASRKPSVDPFDAMNDRDFEREVLKSLDRSTTTISLRVPNDLLGRTREAAARHGVRYQSLIKVLIDQGITRLERGAATRAPRRRRQARPKRATAQR